LYCEAKIHQVSNSFGISGLNRLIRAVRFASASVLQSCLQLCEGVR